MNHHSLALCSVVLFGVAASATAAPTDYAARRAQIEAKMAQEHPPQSQCGPNQMLWRRDKTSAFCADTCTADFQCGPVSKCRIMGTPKVKPTVRKPKRFDGPAYTSQRPLKPGEFGLCDPFWVVVPSHDRIDQPPASEKQRPPGEMTLEEQFAFEGRALPAAQMPVKAAEQAPAGAAGTSP